MRRRGRRGCLTWTQEGNAIIQSGEGLLSRVGQQRKDTWMYNKVRKNKDSQVRDLALIILRFLCCNKCRIYKATSQFPTQILADDMRGGMRIQTVAREAEVAGAVVRNVRVVYRQKT